MSNLCNNSTGKMGSPFFNELKKQASFFFKEKIKTARLALTDVTPAQILTEEATNGNQWAPDTKTLKIISRAAFEVDDYWRIVNILHNRLMRFDRVNWRQSYNAVIVLEHLLTHGPESVAEEFQSDKDVIKEMENFQYIDEKGFNWGLTVANKSAKILKLLEEKHLLKEERNRARKLTRGIQGFSSFANRTTPAQEIHKESSSAKYARCNSEFNHHENDENNIPYTKEASINEFSIKKVENIECQEPNENHLKENMVLDHVESKPLLANESGDGIFVEEDHPFNEAGQLSTASLLSGAGKILQAC